jgi:predicted small integral membrane protein
MSPFIGGLAVVAGAIAIALFVGAVGGAIHGRLRGELSLGALLVLGAYALIVIALESWSSRKIVVFGMLPLMLTFLVSSLTTQLLATRARVRPMIAALAGFGSALFLGFLYLMLIRFDWLPLVDPNTAWVALAALSCLILLSIRKRLRA